MSRRSDRFLSEALAHLDVADSVLAAQVRARLAGQANAEMELYLRLQLDDRRAARLISPEDLVTLKAELLLAERRRRGLL